jgi:hypothetical protein
MRLAIVVFLVGVAPPIRAEPGFSLGVEGGVMQWGPSASFGAAGVAWGLRGGIGLIGNLRLEARFLSARRDLSAGMTATAREGDAQLRVALRSGLTPYAFGGIGLRSSDIDAPGAAGSDSAIMVPFGVGLDLPLNRLLVVAPEFTWHHRVDEAMAPSPAPDDTWNVALVVRLEL